MSKPNVIFLSIDRLHAGYLGAYGNTWIETPNYDALASQSIVFDRATIDTPQLELQYRSLWHGIHALQPMDIGSERRSIAARFAEAGWLTAMVTDDSQIASVPGSSDFAETIDISSAINAAKNSGGHIVEDIEQTQVALFFAEAINWFEASRRPFFLWLHTGSLGRIWDAPLEFREQYADEDDPEPATWSEPPNRVLAENFDPDELLSITHAYAGQVSLVDQLLGSLTAVIAERGLNENTLLVCFSPRGFPLGEHHRVGPCDDALYSELTHVPLLMRAPVAFLKPGRTQALVQPADIAASILDFCGLENEGSSNSARRLAGIGRSLMPLLRGEQVDDFDRACIVGGSRQEAIVTPAWSLRASSALDAGTPNDDAVAAEGIPTNSHAELFVKPDDWFEVNEVSNRCGEVVEQLHAAYDEFAAACRADESVVLAPLREELVLGLD